MPEVKVKWCPFINGECRKDCMFYWNGRECGLHEDMENLRSALLNGT